MSRSRAVKDFWFELFGKRSSEQLEYDLEALDEEERRKDEGGGEDVEVEAGVDDGNEEKKSEKKKRYSLYVRVFEEMVNVILWEEKHLLSEAEWDILKVYKSLDYNARYLLVRLVLRQPDWHSLSSLQKYTNEIGEEGLEDAIKTLCGPIQAQVVQKGEDPSIQPSQTAPSTPNPVPTPIVVKEESLDIINLTFDKEEDNKPKLPKLGPTNKPHSESTTASTSAFLFVKPSMKTSTSEIQELVVDPFDLRFDYLFRDQSSMTVEETLNHLTVPELKEIAKSMKVQSRIIRKEALIQAMIKHAAGQHTLPQLTKGKGKGKQAPVPKWDGKVQTQLSFGQKPKPTKEISQLKRLREMALERLGPCLKINPNLYRLIGRLHIICYRGTEKPTKPCLPALLAGFRKWNFPPYAYERDPTIWMTREELLEFEEALYLDSDMENPPELVAKANANAINNRNNTEILDRFKTPITPARNGNADIDMEPPSTSRLGIISETPRREEDEDKANTNVKESISIQRAKHIKKLYKERIGDKWRMLLKSKDQEKGKGKEVERTPGLERFEAGHVYTRMMGKVANAFGILKDYKTELGILKELLKQTHWRKGKRAGWYERRALIQERYIEPKNFEVVKAGIHEALDDEYTGIVNRPNLIRRLQRIEKRMKLHPEKRTPFEGVLREPEVVSFSGKRTELRPGTKLNEGIIPMNEKVINPLVSDYFPMKTSTDEPEKEPEKNVNRTVMQVPAPEASSKKTGKSSWVGYSDEAVNVEGLSLQYYEMSGYVGFHSETRILTTIFGLIFWDIIFSPVRGAFETPFQAGPLDIFEDSFYLARQPLFEKRLREIKEGKAKEYLVRHDNMFRHKQTYCIGLRWDVCEQKQLLEILECLGAQTLAMICQLFCEDYGGRCSGVPDLIVWKIDEGICKFVEVKGPGDSPQPNQRLWFDSLLRANANIEICRVIDQDAPELKKRKRKTPASKKKLRKTKDESDHQDVEVQCGSDEEEEYLPMPNPKRIRLDVETSELLLPQERLETPSPCSRRQRIEQISLIGLSPLHNPSTTKIVA